METQRYWYLRDPYAWIVLVLGIITAVVIDQAWVFLLGVVGYLIALLVEITRGRSLGRTGAIRLARAEQEVRELQAERARLLGAIQDLEGRLTPGEGLPEAAKEPDLDSPADQAMGENLAE